MIASAIAWIIASKPARSAIAIGAALLALGVAIFRLIGMGRKIERNANNEKAVENENARKNIDLALSVATPAERERLRRKWSEQ